MDDLEILLHPIRIRIMHAIFSGGAHTVPEVHEKLPDLARKVVDEQISFMSDSGLVDVTGRDKFHVAISQRGFRHFHEAARGNPDNYRHRVSTALTVLAEEVGSYLDGEEKEIQEDALHVLQHPVWLSPAEVAELTIDLVRAVRKKLDSVPTNDRKPYFLSQMLFPSCIHI